MTEGRGFESKQGLGILHRFQTGSGAHPASYPVGKAAGE